MSLDVYFLRFSDVEQNTYAVGIILDIPNSISGFKNGEFNNSRNAYLVIDIG
jgi:hypothetical protein